MRRRSLRTIALYAGVALTCAILVFPIYWLVVTALSEPSQLRQLPPSFWPAEPRWGVFGGRKSGV